MLSLSIPIHLHYTQFTYTVLFVSDRMDKMIHDKKDNKNIILVVVIIGLFLIFMLGSAVYTTSKVMNCSSGKKLRNAC